MNTVLKRIIPLITALLPFSAFAEPERTLNTILDNFSDLFDSLIIFFFLLATAVFFWGIIKYLTAGGDEEKIKEARQMIIWGVIFLAVMVAVWGFVDIVLDFIFSGTETSGTPTPIPKGPAQP